LKTIEAVLASHVEALMAVPGVVGTAIGVSGIRVFLAQESADARQRIPIHLEGYPVSVEITGPVTKRRQTYEAPEIIVTFDPDVCIHSGVCVRGLPDVFDIKRKRWIRPELRDADVVAAQVERCPSAALQYVRKEKAD